MALPDVVSHEQWLRARTELLVREKQLTRQREEAWGEPQGRVESARAAMPNFAT